MRHHRIGKRGYRLIMGELNCGSAVLPLILLNEFSAPTA
jgi:hypothetical protein